MFNKKPKCTVKQAMKVLTKAIRKDKDYAHSWHCNIACCAVDEGASHRFGNVVASRVMKQVFNVVTHNEMLSDPDDPKDQ